jgi:hypothetical protein
VVMLAHGRHGGHGNLSHVTAVSMGRHVMWWWVIFSGQGSSRTDSRLHTWTFGRKTQMLESLTTQAISLVLTFLGTQRIVQELLFYFGSFLLWFGQNPINLFLLFQGSLARSVILPLTAVLKLHKNGLFFFGSFRFRHFLNIDDAVP